MDRYQRVEQRKVEQDTIQENEVRIMAAGKMRNYITYATTLLSDKGHSAVLLKAMGRAINKTVTIAEIIKRRISGLHQLTEIASVDITDTWEPLEEGLSRLETTRHVSVITITLSTTVEGMNTNAPGYQEPLAEDLVKPLQEGPPAGSRPRGGQGRGNPRPEGEVAPEQEPPQRAYGGGGRRGGRGRGRGRGGRRGQSAPPPQA